MIRDWFDILSKRMVDQSSNVSIPKGGKFVIEDYWRGHSAVLSLQCGHVLGLAHYIINIRDQGV